MIKLKKLTGVLLLLSSCNSLQGNSLRMDDKAYKEKVQKVQKAYEESKASNDVFTSAALNRVLASTNASNDGGNGRKETIGPAPEEWVQRQNEERAKNERRGAAMLEAFAAGDVVSREGDITGCSIL